MEKWELFLCRGQWYPGKRLPWSDSSIDGGDAAMGVSIGVKSAQPADGQTPVVAHTRGSESLLSVLHAELLQLIACGWGGGRYLLASIVEYCRAERLRVTSLIRSMDLSLEMLMFFSPLKSLATLYVCNLILVQSIRNFLLF